MAAPIHCHGVRFQSTHPVRGATRMLRGHPCPKSIFQSTHPVRGATKAIRLVLNITEISIHAPREGCDFQHLQNDCITENFNPRTP